MSTEFRATYRVQFQPGFGFDDAAEILTYLADLGISHLYSSPYLQAAAGSTHGYDVVDHQRVNSELGGAEGHARLSTALAAHGLGQVLDIVPNHMAIGGRVNAWWWDVLRHGAASEYASYFDVDWEREEPWLRGAVLLPVLGDHYWRLLKAGEIRVGRDEQDVVVQYADQSFPVSPQSLLDLVSVQDASESEIEAFIAAVNADLQTLHRFLNLQHYRLGYWRSAEHRLNMRRFMDVSSLAGLRVEEMLVFEAVHALPLRWLREGVIQGLRVDHPDGLYDPAQYLDRLANAAPGAWLVVEKILGTDEPLRANWKVDGTTGYDFLNQVGGLFVEPSAGPAFTRIYERFTGESAQFTEVVRTSKLSILGDVLRAEFDWLVATFAKISELRPEIRDFETPELVDALREVIVAFPIYRSYVVAETGSVDEDDIGAISGAIEAAREKRPDLAVVIEFLRDLLLLRIDHDDARAFSMRFQQTTGPIMAKSVEDTTFYRYYRLASLNEVGGDPDRFGVSAKEFHEWATDIQKNWPRTMLTTSTHDTKRGEDVRIRQSVLSQMPARWVRAVQRWFTMNERYRENWLPDRNTEYLLYQTLVGTWPIESDRVLVYMEKAIREAKQYTSWRYPDDAYERGVLEFARRILDDSRFVLDLERFVADLRKPAQIASLGQTLARLTAPGIPDTFQGTELWDLNLVDPDNRRPVDFATRRALLKQLESETPDSIWAQAESGLPKLWVLQQALKVRKRLPVAFESSSSYTPIYASGPAADHVVAFGRGNSVITIFPRIVVGRDDGWAASTLYLPDGSWRNVLADECHRGEVTLGDVFARFPVALLVRVESA